MNHTQHTHARELREKKIIMKMPELHCSLQYIVDKIPFIAEDVSIETFGHPNMGMYVDAISLYSVDEAQPKPSNVYLCRPEQLSHLNPSYRDAVLLCINNQPQLPQVPKDYHILVIQCSHSLEFVFNALQKTIFNLKLNNGRIDRAILEDSSIQEILPIVEQTMKNPFLLLDAEFKLLGWSKTKECSEAIYTDTVRSGYLPNEYVLELISHDCLRKLYAQGTVVLPKGELLDNHTVLILMLKNEHMILGYGILICSQRELRPPMIQGFQEIMGKFQTSLQKNADITYTQNKSEILFYILLLNGSITNHSEIRARARELNISSTGEYVLYVLQCTGRMPSRYAFRAFANDVLTSEPAFLYDNCILVVESSGERAHSLLDKPAFHKFLSEYQALAGISTLFYHVEDIPNAYAQAKRSIEIGSTLNSCQERMYFTYDQNTFRYSDYAPYLLIEQSYGKTGHFPITCPRLLNLIDQDQKKKSDYALTLLVYLKNNGHIMDTAQEMFFHRNSILKRMKQISEALKLDLSDYNVRSELLFHFKVIDYAKAIGQTEALMELIH